MHTYAHTFLILFTHNIMLGSVSESLSAIPSNPNGTRIFAFLGATLLISHVNDTLC